MNRANTHKASTQPTRSPVRVLVPLCGDLSAGSGGKTYAQTFLNEIQRDDRGIHWLIGLESSSIAQTRQTTSRARITWLPFPKWSVSSLGRLLFEQLRLPAIIRSTDPDVVFFSANFLTILSKTPSVLSIRSLLYYHYPNEISKARLIGRKFLTRMAVRKATKIVCPSQSIARDIHKILNVPEERITTVLHGTNHAYLDASSDDTILDRLELRGKHYFIYPSALWQYKNHLTLIRAARKLAQRNEKVVVVFAGKGLALRTSHIEMLEREAANVESPGQIIFAGEVQARDLNTLYTNSIALLFPSASESFGNPIAEAMARSCPVVAANCHALPEIVGKGGILLDPFDSDQWAEEMSRLANQPEHRRIWAERSSAHKHRYLADRAIDQLVEVIRCAAPNPPVQD